MALKGAVAPVRGELTVVWLNKPDFKEMPLTVLSPLVNLGQVLTAALQKAGCFFKITGQDCMQLFNRLVNLTMTILDDLNIMIDSL
jgi:hypothetical protein